MKINSKSNKSDLLARLAELGVGDLGEGRTAAEMRDMIAEAEAQLAATSKPATPALTGTFDGKPVGSKRARRTSPEAAVAAVRAAETPVAADDRVARLAQAKVEKKALDSFVKNGKKGERPATPNLDALAAAPAKTKTTKAPKPVQTVRFVRNGKPFNDLRISSLAYQSTKGIESDDSPRISTTAFLELLAASGITEPTTSTWAITLPNGTQLEAVKLSK